MKKIDWKDLIISILVPVGLGFIVGLITKDFNDFATLNKPFFAPPGIIFPIAWTIILYSYGNFLIMALVMPRKVILMRYNFF